MFVKNYELSIECLGDAVSKKRPIQFEFGDTEESRTFFGRHPLFFGAFQRLAELSNAGLGPRAPSSKLEDVCHRLGNTCRNDFLSILFLVVNGYGLAATQLLRGMYERSVTLANLIKHPDKVERFIQYAAVVEYRLVQEARKLFSDEQINAAFKANSIEEVQENFDKFKVPFLRKGGKKTTPTWDVDFASQVRELGSPFTDYYLSAYLMPNSHVHATLTSIMLPEERLPPEVQADLTLMMAHILFLKVLDLHGGLFGLAHKGALEACNQDFYELWLGSRSPQGASSSEDAL
ncbi:MAG TPA: DUF5677 domain-containing protein [Bryobacteraceae bacterium]|jgi:hypothetical protein|nr:DUF5677 domain-containing protein [Bryobacteraceae bacterium]